jgi:hypothetical protein
MTHDPAQVPAPPSAYPPPAYPPPAYPPPYATPSAAAAPAPARDGKTQAIAIALFATAIVTLVGVVTKSWFTVPGGGVGLTGVEACRGSRCMSISWSDIPHVPSDIALWGYLGIIAGVAAVGVACAMGGMLLAGKLHKIPVRPFEIVLGVAAFATTMFLMRLYSDDPRHASFGYSGFVAIGGLVVIGALTRQGVAKLKARA